MKKHICIIEDEYKYFDANFEEIHEGDYLEYHSGRKEKIYLSTEGQLCTDATNPNWIKIGRAMPTEFGLYHLTNDELETAKLAK